MHGNSGGRQLERLSGPNKEFEGWKERGEVPMLPGQVFAAPPGLHGIDTNTVLDDAIAALQRRADSPSA
jgi:hypothetical protein